jgi:tRNA A-37 threonylcarbamoyl transferase component Bud32
MAQEAPAPVHPHLVVAESDAPPPRLSLKSLPPALIERAPARLGWTALACLVTSLAMFLVGGLLQPATAAAQKRLLVRIAEVVVIATATGLLVIERTGRLRPLTLLRVGLVFEIVVAASIAVIENAAPWQPDVVIRGYSLLALWIAAYTLVVPMPLPVSILAGAAAASLGPIFHYLLAALQHYPPLPFNLVLLYYFPSYLMLAMAGFLSARMLRLEWSIAKARELGSYELIEPIARGGMGEVWRAHHRLLKRDAAIKLIRPDALAARAGRQAKVMRMRFEREAQITASLRSPHTVELYDFGVTDEGGFFYAMEFLEGLDLERLVRDYGPQPPARVVHILLQACASLQEAHHRGLVHRDIKPTNFFLCRLGVESDFVKLLDFGLVKRVLPDDSHHVTLDGHTTGTPAFLAPELALGEDQIDARADIYGLGCVAYWLLTGKVVFDERTPMATALAHIRKEPLPPSARTESEIPASLETLVMSCLAKDPAGRPESAAKLRRLLAHCRDVPVWTQEEADRWWQSVAPDERQQK